MAGKRVGILGATGAVGMEMAKVLYERRFPLAELRLLASARSAGRQLPFGDGTLPVQEANADAFAGLDIVLGAAENDVAKALAPAIYEAGAVFVDNSSAFRMNKDVPLIVPEINGADVQNHNGLISNPNCSTIIALMALYGINRLSPIKKLVAATYQAVSGAGIEGQRELLRQTEALVNGGEAAPQVFPYQIAYNLIPQIGGFDDEGYTSEEMKMQNEGRKILHLPALAVTCTCVRVPVLRSHSIAVTFVTEAPVSVADAKAAIAASAGCVLLDDPENKRYPMPLETSDQDLVFVGRVRRDLTDPNGLSLWCCGDQVRKGAATNAVQIAELL